MSAIAPHERTEVLPPNANPFESAPAPATINEGTVTIESQRAIAEVKARVVMARQFPRNQGQAYMNAMQSCKRKGLADVAIFRFPRGGGQVEGPSIRLAEELARCWGNIEYGIRELSRSEGKSEMQAFAWDMETNTLSTQNFTVSHIRDKRGGGAKLTDERDIYEITANMGARRLRARILAVLPPELVDDAVAACMETRTSNIKQNLQDNLRKMMQAMSGLGVTGEMLTGYLGHDVMQSTPDEVSDLRGVYEAIKNGMGKVGDYFGMDKPKMVANTADPFASEKKAEPKKAATILARLKAAKTFEDVQALTAEAEAAVEAADKAGNTDEAATIDGALQEALRRTGKN